MFVFGIRRNCLETILYRADDETSNRKNKRTSKVKTSDNRDLTYITKRQKRDEWYIQVPF